MFAAVRFIAVVGYLGSSLNRGDDLVELFVFAEARDGAGREELLRAGASFGGRGERDDAEPGELREQLRRRLDAVEARHPVVDQHDVGPVLERRSEGRSRRRRRPRRPRPRRASRASARAPRGRPRCPRRARHEQPCSEHLFRAEQQRVVRLAALVHFDLDLRDARRRCGRRGRRAAAAPRRSGA